MPLRSRRRADAPFSYAGTCRNFSINTYWYTGDYRKWRRTIDLRSWRKRWIVREGFGDVGVRAINIEIFLKKVPLAEFTIKLRTQWMCTLGRTLYSQFRTLSGTGAMLRFGREGGYGEHAP